MKQELKKILPGSLWERLKLLRFLTKNLGNFEKRAYEISACLESIEFITNRGNPWYKEIPEPGLIDELASQASSDTVFYDVGAHFGFHSRAVHAAGTPLQKIHAFEAELVPYYMLKKNGSQGLNTTRSFVGYRGEHLSIDEYTEKNPAPSLVKIDVEGAEGEVLKGMENTVQREKPKMYIEIHPKKMQNFRYNINDIFEKLRVWGYVLEIIENEREQGPIKNPSPSDFSGKPDLSLKASAH